MQRHMDLLASATHKQAGGEVICIDVHVRTSMLDINTCIYTYLYVHEHQY